MAKMWNGSKYKDSLTLINLDKFEVAGYNFRKDDSNKLMILKIPTLKE